MIIKDNMANMCAKVTSTYMEFTLAFGPKPEFKFSFNFFYLIDWFYYTMNLIVEQVFFSAFFAIHLPPIEEGEFLLYIMLKLDKKDKKRRAACSSHIVVVK